MSIGFSFDECDIYNVNARERQCIREFVELAYKDIDGAIIHCQHLADKYGFDDPCGRAYKRICDWLIELRERERRPLAADEVRELAKNADEILTVGR